MTLTPHYFNMFAWKIPAPSMIDLSNRKTAIKETYHNCGSLAAKALRQGLQAEAIRDT